MSAAFLLDVNILIAMAWPWHQARPKVLEWLSRHAAERWATCPLTQIAFVRVVSNPAFSMNAPAPAEALALLQSNLVHPSHQFWPDEVSFPKALEPFLPKFVGHQQVTDAYLLGLVIHKKGKLATMDRGILELLPQKSRFREFVELI